MTQRHTVLFVLAFATFAMAQDQPRVLLTSASKGSNWSSTRDQTIELTKDFQKDCTQVRVTTLQEKADYTITLNHIEHGFARDNQFLLSNKDGDVLYTKEGGSIDKNVKYACTGGPHVSLGLRDMGLAATDLGHPPNYAGHLLAIGGCAGREPLASLPFHIGHIPGTRRTALQALLNVMPQLRQLRGAQLVFGFHQTQRLTLHLARGVVAS
jgi:hypothetical protein